MGLATPWGQKDPEMRLNVLLLAAFIALAPAARTVWADPMALQIIGNLVDNSVRHTASGSVTRRKAPQLLA